jgi:UDP-3-O-[3-hydroxymyristoyl] glucosamine N-acyltransferase
MTAITLGELARAIDAVLDGDPAIEVTGVAGLDEAGPGDLSFLTNPRYRDAATRSSAGAIVVGSDDRIDSRNVLRCKNPYLSFAKAVELLTPMERPAAGVDPSAIVHPSVKVPDDVSIGPCAIVEEEVTLSDGVTIGAGTLVEREVSIGEGTRIFPHVTIHRGTRIGRSCVVQSGTVLGSEGFGYATDDVGRHHPVPQRGGLLIGDEVDIGANVTIDRGSIGDTVIGAGTKIDNLVHVAHNVRIGRNAVIVAQVGIAGSTRIGDFVVIGGQAGIGGHITIGDGSRVGGQAGVLNDIPPATEVSGYLAGPHHQQLRIQALVRRLPELFERLKALEERLRDR